MKRYTLATTYHDYEAHGTTPSAYKVKIQVWALNYRHAIIKANKWIKQQNNEFNRYDYILLPHKRVRV